MRRVALAKIEAAKSAGHGETATLANTRSEVWYGGLEGGEVVNDVAVTDTLQPHPSSLRCSCAGCLASRAALRENAIHGALRPKNGPGSAWADRSWDGPLAEFPGHGHSDATPARRTHRHSHPGRTATKDAKP